MLEELEHLLPNFDSLCSHVRCFAHTLNLTAKSTLGQFEVKKNNDGKPDSYLIDNAEHHLLLLAQDIEIDNTEARVLDIEQNGVGEKDDIEGLFDAVEGMTEQERVEWKDTVRPIRSVLVKVHNIFTLTYSGTHLFVRRAKSHSRLSTLPLCFSHVGVRH